MAKELTIENINTPNMLGIALKRIRKQANMSQDDLAKIVNMRQATISDLENGRGTLDSLFKVIQVLKINVLLSNQTSLQRNVNKSKAKEVIDLLND